MGNIMLSLGMENRLPTFLVNARDHFDKAAERDPDNVDIDVSKARLMLANRDVEGARKQLAGALEKNGSSYDARVLLGALLVREGATLEAAGILDTATKLAPANPDAFLLAGTAAAKSDRHPEAVSFFLSHLINLPSPAYVPFPDVHGSKGELKQLMARSIQQTLRLDPDHREALKLLDITVNLN
jgi:tetratricopeptide (TPR) repeat protein